MPTLDDSPDARDDRRERERARRSEAPMGDDDIRARVQRVTLRQQQFERHVADVLAVDAPGLEAMDHLISTGAATPTELARRLGISTAAMTLVLHRLEKAGHIRRERHPHDGRKLVVTAVDRSRDRARDLVTPLIDGIERVVDEMDAAERATVQHFLDRLIGVYDHALDAANPPRR
ncbi:MarR family transcriptional regulator [Microbacterium sp. VKM Ac-2923]|uniref:MarR family winged helix-turn-helix transcriptional regulator n=1 Tax=Microbacterium sp. VKM Ac-2923 TaxID=2929476 RepID=UPI001FB54F25|nr:MarR family transcriptional regulator [Microbacterium sp. VKM Ac-2923]MCJ1709183.1 MarR family transcriptional regulator [Microbacterium sp. VKM Ac-2923]